MKILFDPWIKFLLYSSFYYYQEIFNIHTAVQLFQIFEDVCLFYITFLAIFFLIFVFIVIMNNYHLQAKFNTFVLNLRNEYSNKVTTFRQVITIHREDSFRTNTYWQETVKVRS